MIVTADSIHSVHITKLSGAKRRDIHPVMNSSSFSFIRRLKIGLYRDEHVCTYDLQFSTRDCSHLHVAAMQIMIQTKRLKRRFFTYGVTDEFSSTGLHT